MAETEENPRGLYQHDEEGLQGIAVDPDFEENRWVYLYYSPRLNTPTDVVGTGINEGDAPFDVITAEDRARLALFAASRRPATSCCRASSSRAESSISRPSRRSSGCRRTVASAVTWAVRSISITAGTCICRRVMTRIRSSRRVIRRSRPGDAQSGVRRAAHGGQHERSARQAAADPVRDNGSYAIPAGNLFGRNQARTRPEIFAMGLRNPFRFAVNRRTGDVYVGDYSPDANMADPARGPAGQGRWILVRRPANYGWPFCATPDKPYVDYDFTPSAPQSGEEFNCFSPTNDRRTTRA